MDVVQSVGADGAASSREKSGNCGRANTSPHVQALLQLIFLHLTLILESVFAGEVALTAGGWISLACL